VRLVLPPRRPSASTTSQLPGLVGVTVLLDPSLGALGAPLERALTEAGATPLHPASRDVARRFARTVAEPCVWIRHQLATRIDPEGPPTREVVIAPLLGTPPRRVGTTAVALSGLRVAHVIEAVATLADDPRGGPSPRARHRSLGPPPTRVAEILVAEDDPTNRIVISRQLAVLGCRATLVGDGDEALAAWAPGRFDVILSDCHMPKRDGYGLVAAIRAAERAAGHPRTPIFALTANAVRGEAQRALEAGFDEYLTKPIALAQLRAHLEPWLTAPADESAQSRTVTLPVEVPVLDVAPLRELFDDDHAELASLLETFRATTREDVRGLLDALSTDDDARVARLAHRLKSSAFNVRAIRLANLAAAFERGERPEASAAALERVWRDVDEALVVAIAGDEEPTLSGPASP
jgi:CheY-like chemotaxis protein/HPt (histidine-containing phosphotransfer) domain-containing protein